ncbi:MAG: ATP-binding protein [Chloroflexi bacterium]|nr:ATP-binding protein [Chloroflexota bacterium]
MVMRLADRLSAARHDRFVGRADELAVFRAALIADELPFCLLHVYGPGGVGKTTLLQQFARFCQQAMIPVIALDGRSIDPSPDGFLHALRLALNLDLSETPLTALAAHPARQVLLIDTYEKLAPLDAWLRDHFLPNLPEQALIVLADRRPPALAWRTDPGWQALIRVLPLRNLSPDESQRYLTQRAVPFEQQRAVLNFTHGHPLALSLVADVFAQRQDIRFQPATAPDVIKTLLEHFVQKVPGPAHRTALEACALVHLMTEALLCEMLGTPDAHELFDWLRGLSFIEAGRRGVFPHDLAREALVADLRWRNPDWYAELHRRARVYYAHSFHHAGQHEQQRLLFDYVFLHRENPVLCQFFEWQENGSLFAATAQEHERPALIEMIARHEGTESARLAEFWFARQPENLVVIRNADQQPVGLQMKLALHQTTPAEREIDPATEAVWNYIQANAPLRQGEVATFFRFWMSGDDYQSVSAIQSLLGVLSAQHYMTTPGLALSFTPCADADFWQPVLSYIDLTRLPEADFVVGERRYGVFGHDWRSVPPLAWLALLAERELNVTSALPRPQSTPQLIVLSATEFASAVRQVLGHFSHPELLGDNPLLKSRLVVEAAGAQADTQFRVAALHTLVKSAVESLQASPREAKCYRALYHTYLHPAATQEQAAELLDLPFSTFRRHLKTGIARVIEILWQRELNTAPG